MAIEGLIGVGKSTVLEILAAYNYDVRPEPLDAWTLLTQFYRERSANAFAFEAQVLCSYCHDDFGRARTNTVVMERSPDSAVDVFARMLRDEGHLSNSEWAHLKALQQNLPIKAADAFVYLSAPTDVCKRRIDTRQRASEAGRVTGAYLESLAGAYESFLAYDKRPSVVLRLTGEESPKTVAELVAAAITRIVKEVREV